MTSGEWSVFAAAGSQKLDRKPCGVAVCVIARASFLGTFERWHGSASASDEPFTLLSEHR